MHKRPLSPLHKLTIETYANPIYTASMEHQNKNRVAAKLHFEQARRQATIEKFSSLISGRNYHSVPFDTIRGELRQQNPFYRGIEDIPVAAIIGSVGRYREFTRHFLPLQDSLVERWIDVENVSINQGWPPIEVYQIGETYFVKDGNHRVSVAKYMKSATIEAHVWEYPIDIAIHPDDNVDKAIITLGIRNFMEKTHLDELFPEHNIRFTTPGRYGELLSQIADIRRKLTEAMAETPSENEVVTTWYQMIYIPTILIIHRAKLLESFPGRTEADLFVWLSKHRERLGQKYGDYNGLVELAECLATQYKENGLQKVTRRVRRLLGHDDLPELDEGEPLVRSN